MNTQRVGTFPSVRLTAPNGEVSVEVSLIAQLGHGAGDQLHARASRRQAAHAEFIDALDEPSARLGAPHFAQGDPSALYSFAVGERGHPFHRHAGARMFSAVSGSGGARLRFSAASMAQVERDPQGFVDTVRNIDIPPDCLFTVRFGPGLWHQFGPWRGGRRHPVLFALSCHADELSGALSPSLRARVRKGEAGIAALTEVLPAPAQAFLEQGLAQAQHMPSIELSVEAGPSIARRLLCASVRCVAGLLRGAWARYSAVRGYQAMRGEQQLACTAVPPRQDSLLHGQFAVDGWMHEDHHRIRVPRSGSDDAAHLLGRLLDAFLEHPPRGVTRLMHLRNALVRPIGLRTSSLGCPVSSLLDPNPSGLFLGRFPVREQRTAADGRSAQVVLGADDRHLRFRSCVSVRCTDDAVEIDFGTRVQCRNAFGRFYMAVVDPVHRRYIAPRMLREAVLQAHIVTTRDMAATAAEARSTALHRTL